MEELKKKIRRLSENSLIDEIRFIDAGDLGYPELFEGRQPRELMPEAKSLIICSIYIGAFSLPEGDGCNFGKTSRLTLSGFYFNVVDPLQQIRSLLNEAGFRAHIGDGSADSGCIPLKPAAVKAGLGWTGKNTLLLNEKYGSWQALGVILTDAELAETYEPSPNRCGTCHRCMDACPMNALETPRVLKRDRCLSDLLEGEEISEEALQAAQGYIFECDICQNCCPWNAQHLSSPLHTAGGETFTNRKSVENLLSFDELERIDEERYRTEIMPNLAGIELSFEGFKRNVAAASRTCRK